MGENPLFHQIEKRQTNRSVYNGNKVSNEMLQQLQSIQKEDAVQFYFAEIGTPFADTIIKYMLKGNEIQMNDAAFKNELLSWMRFNKKRIKLSRFRKPAIARNICTPHSSLIPKIQYAK